MKTSGAAKRKEAREVFLVAEIIAISLMFVQIPEHVGRDAVDSSCLRRIEHPFPLLFGHTRIVNLSRNQQLPLAPNEERAFVKGYGSPMIPGIGQRILAHITLQNNYLTSSVSLSQER